MNDKELMEMEIENLEEDRKQLLNYVNQLRTRWDSLREYVKEFQDSDCCGDNCYMFIDDLLDKMNELKGGDNVRAMGEEKTS